MKKCISILSSMLIMAFLITGCGSSKQASFDGEKAVEKSPSQKMAEEKPAVREWGEATNFNLSFAKTYAEGQARAAFQRKLATLVQTASRQATDGADQGNSNGEESSFVSDQNFTSNAFAQQVAEGVVKSTPVINCDTYKKADKQYHVFVCIEWNGSVADLANEMTQNYKNKVNQQISDEDRIKMEYRYQKFKESIEDQLKRLRGEEEK